MAERTGLVTMKGNPVTLVGDEVGVGQPAPEVKLSSFRGKVCILTSVPSLDTPVCDIETRRFNEETDALGDGVVVVAVSMDLPFAQARWCGAAGAQNVQTLSDLLIKGLRLLARAVFVLDKDGIVRYQELVPEITAEPDYEAALQAARELL